MITVTCKYTNEVFEADSKRTTTHPQVRRFLDDTAKFNTTGYRAAVDALAEVKSSGMTLTEKLAYAQAAANGRTAEYNAERAAKAQRDAEDYERRQQRKEARQALNWKLGKHGYRWCMTGGDAEQNDIIGTEFGDDREWTLFAADGRIVTVQQALAEIEAK